MPYTAPSQAHQHHVPPKSNGTTSTERRNEVPGHYAPGMMTDMLTTLSSHTCQSVTASQTCRAAKCSSSPTDERSYSAVGPREQSVSQSG